MLIRLRKTLSTAIWLLGMAVLVLAGDLILQTRKQLGISDTTLVLVALFVLLLYINHIRADLLERMGLKGLPTKKWIDGLRFGNPIEPVHEKSKGFPKDGWGVFEGDHLFFEDFAEFADLMNKWFAEDPWRLQEQANTDWPGMTDGPSHGRRYSIFYNQHRVGQLAIKASILPVYSHAEPDVMALVEINHARLLPYGQLSGLHGALIHHLTSPEVYKEEQRAFLSSMLKAVWGLGRGGSAPTPLEFTELEFRISGSASTYLRQRERSLQ
jgi:hypothetical protein